MMTVKSLASIKKAKTKPVKPAKSKKEAVAVFNQENTKTTKDYFDENGKITAKTGKAVACREKGDKYGVVYSIKFNPVYKTLFDPFDVQPGVVEYQFRGVSQRCFNCYCKYLTTNNSAYYMQARAELANEKDG